MKTLIYRYKSTPAIIKQRNSRDYSSYAHLSQTEPPPIVHKSVLLEESIHLLCHKEDGIYLDATFGEGGHTKAILQRFPKAKVVAIDRDLEVARAAKEVKQKYGSRFHFMRARFG